MERRRVVVTGMGMLTPVGVGVEACWQRMVAGQSGIGPIKAFDCAAFPTHFGGEVWDFQATDYLNPKELRRLDTFVQLGMAAGMQAWDDAQLAVEEDNAGRIGVLMGSGIGGIATIEENSELIRKSGPRRVSPFLVPSSIINMIAGNLTIRYGLRGPSIALSTACTTGAHSIGLAARMIQCGDADAFIAGGAENGLTQVGLAGFCAARALSTRNDSPQQASRPWDKDRDGFVLSDGAGAVVLEEYTQARRRGAHIYAELTGFGMSSDAYHITLPAQDGRGAREAMENALRDARLDASQVDYINAHGTSTQAGDRVECLAIRDCLGAHAGKVAVSSVKSMVGHMLGAAGAVEAVCSILSIRDQVAPPTINLDEPEEAWGINLVPHQAQEMKINTVLSNSFGFGGTNGSLVFQSIDE